MLPDKLTADEVQTRSRAKDPVLARTTKVASGVYRVQGEGGVYTVTVSASGYACDCPAGSHGNACWHIASAYRRRLADKMLRAASVAPTPIRSRAADLWGPDAGCPDCGWQYGHRANCRAVAVAS